MILLTDQGARLKTGIKTEYRSTVDCTEKSQKSLDTARFNVVGVDEYEEPGEELYLVGNFPTKKAAERKLIQKQKEIPGQRFYIYPPGEV
jgi:hypothetical protein